MSKRKQAFELFDGGKTPDDPEVQALELEADVLARYFEEWTSTQIAEEEPELAPEPELEPASESEEIAPLVALTIGDTPPEETVEEEPAPTSHIPFVTVSSLPVGQEFEFEGSSYRIRPNRTCILLEWSPSSYKFKIEKYAVNIPADTLVLPI